MSHYMHQDVKLWDTVKIGRSKYRAIGRDLLGVMLWKGSGPTIYVLTEKAAGEFGAHPVAQQFSYLSTDIKRHVRAQQKAGVAASVTRKNIFTWNNPEKARDNIFNFNNPAGEGRSSLDKFAKSLGLHLETWAPGDGVTRYRFFTKPSDYFAGDGIYTALGLKEAWCFVRGYAASKTGARGNPAGEGASKLREIAQSVGLHIGTWAPGDGTTRYRFFTKPSDYFASDGIYTALGLKEAWCFVRGYAARAEGRISRNPGVPGIPTLAEAKQRWKYTKTILTAEARAAYRKGEYWTTTKGGYPAVVSADREFGIVFQKRTDGRVEAVQAYGERSNPAMTGVAQDFISGKIGTLVREGYPQKQAIAIAYSMARKAGYKVPARPNCCSNPKPHVHIWVERTPARGGGYTVRIEPAPTWAPGGRVGWYKRKTDAEARMEVYRKDLASRKNPLTRAEARRLSSMTDEARWHEKFSRSVNDKSGADFSMGQRSAYDRVSKAFVRDNPLLQTVMLANPVSIAFDVYLRGKLIDTVFYSASAKVTNDEVRRALIDHDGYDPAIRVVRRRGSKGNPPISAVWDTLTHRRRHAALEFAGFPDDHARALARSPWSRLDSGAKRALERQWAANPLTKKEAVRVVRDAQLYIKSSLESSESATAAFYAGISRGHAQVAFKYGPKSKRVLWPGRSHEQIISMREKSKRVGWRAQDAYNRAERIPPKVREHLQNSLKNPGIATRIPFREGQRIPIARARAWVERYGTLELKKAFRDAERLQAKANRRPQFVTWKTLPVGDPRKIEMVTALAHYGDTPDTYYKPPKGSRKGRHLYKHSWGETGGKKSVPLLASSSGKALIMPLGGRKVAGDWLRH